MSKVIKAKVLSGRYEGEVVRVSNVSADQSGKRTAACFLADGSRANIAVENLEVLPEAPEPEPKLKGARTASMPFISGSSSSRTMTHTKNMARPKIRNKSFTKNDEEE